MVPQRRTSADGCKQQRPMQVGGRRPPLAQHGKGTVSSAKSRFPGWSLALLWLVVIAYLCSNSLTPVDEDSWRQLHIDQLKYFNWGNIVLGGPVINELSTPEMGLNITQSPGLMPYRDFPIEYPPANWIWILAPRLFTRDIGTYIGLFSEQMALVLTLALALAWRIRPRLSMIAWSSLALAALGPICLSRLDVTVTLLLATSLWCALRDRPVASGLALATATATKLFPVLFVPMFAWHFSKQGGRPPLRRFLLAAGLGLVVWMLPAALIGGPRFMAMFAFHHDRPVQIESLMSSLIMTCEVASRSPVLVDSSFGSINLALPAQLNTALNLLSSLLLLASVAAPTWIYARHDYDPTGARLTRALVAGCLGVMWTSKVLSPQYLVWVVPMAFLLRGNRRFYGALVAACALTHLIFPSCYMQLQAGYGWAVALLLARNALLVACFVLAVLPEGAPEATVTDTASPLGSRQLVALTFVWFLSLYGLTAGGHLYTIDDEICYRLSDSIATRGRLNVQPLEQAGLGGFAVGKGPDGLFYTSKAPGLSLVGAPLVALAKGLSTVLPTTSLPPGFVEPGGPNAGLVRSAADPAGALGRCFWSFLNVVFSAATCALLLDLALQVGLSVRTSLLVTAIYGCTTVAWVYASHSAFGEPLLTLCTLAAFSCAYRWRLALGLAACVCAALTKITALGLFPILAGFCWLEGRRRFPSAGGGVRPSLAYLGAGAATLLVTGWLNDERFGSWLETGYGLEQHAHGTGLPVSPELLAHLTWLITSWGKGLLLYSLPVLLFIPAFVPFARRQPAASLAIGAIGANYLLAAAAWYDWAGGSSWGPRLLLPMMPLWVLPIGFLLELPEPAQRSRWRLGVGIASAFSLLIQLTAVPINWLEWLMQAYRNIEQSPAWRSDMAATDLHSICPTVAEIVDQVVLFHPSMCPVVGNLRVMAEGHWDLIWISQPAEVASHGVGGIGLFLAIALTGASLMLVSHLRSERGSAT